MSIFSRFESIAGGSAPRGRGAAGEAQAQLEEFVPHVAADQTLDHPVNPGGVQDGGAQGGAVEAGQGALDGLAALSSRNGYLTAEERAIAPVLYATLTASAERLRAGERDCERLASEAKARLAAAGFRPDYFEIRRARDLQSPADGDTDLRILAAAWLGRARLIDNLAV